MLNISGIENGYVIDHIKAGKAMQIYQALGLDKVTCEVAIINNAHSNKQGRKDIIKIEERIDLDWDLLSFLTRSATVNVIENGHIVEKRKLEQPKQIVGLIACKNPRCITSTERGLVNTFKLTDPEKNVYRCIYCEEKLDKKTVKW